MRIRELTPTQCGRYACTVFIFQGRHLAGARLIHHALALEPKQADAIRSLSDFLDEEGTESLAAAVLEHGLDPATGLADEERRPLDELLFRCKWWWGFSKHDSGLKSLGDEDFRDRTHFVVDGPRYREFLEGMIQRAGSLAGAFRAAHTLIGAIAGLIEHRQLGRKAPFEEILHIDRFSRTPAYDAWLEEDTAPLDELEKKREEAVKKSAEGGAGAGESTPR